MTDEDFTPIRRAINEIHMNNEKRRDSMNLAEVCELARSQNLSFELHFCQSDNTWFFATENYVGKNRSFNVAKESFIKHLQERK